MAQAAELGTRDLVGANDIGLEVESITDPGAGLKDFIVGEVIACEKHPNADKLRLCKVSDGKDNLQIVCGAPNARAGIKVVLARPGTVIPAGTYTAPNGQVFPNLPAFCRVAGVSKPRPTSNIGFEVWMPWGSFGHRSCRV